MVVEMGLKGLGFSLEGSGSLFVCVFSSVVESGRRHERDCAEDLYSVVLHAQVVTGSCHLRVSSCSDEYIPL